MEDWQLDFEFLRIQNIVKKAMRQDAIPDLNQVLLLVGIQELGKWKKKFTKEEKQDLMHIAVCKLLSYEEYFEFEGLDTDGWPHWKQVREMAKVSLQEQERMLKIGLLQYFKTLESENGGWAELDN